MSAIPRKFDASSDYDFSQNLAMFVIRLGFQILLAVLKVSRIGGGEHPGRANKDEGSVRQGKTVDVAGTGGGE